MFNILLLISIISCLIWPPPSTPLSQSLFLPLLPSPSLSRHPLPLPPSRLRILLALHLSLPIYLYPCNELALYICSSFLTHFLHVYHSLCLTYQTPSPLYLLPPPPYLYDLVNLNHLNQSDFLPLSPPLYLPFHNRSRSPLSSFLISPFFSPYPLPLSIFSEVFFSRLPLFTSLLPLASPFL